MKITDKLFGAFDGAMAKLSRKRSRLATDKLPKLRQDRVIDPNRRSKRAPERLDHFEKLWASIAKKMEAGQKVEIEKLYATIAAFKEHAQDEGLSDVKTKAILYTMVKKVSEHNAQLEQAQGKAQPAPEQPDELVKLFVAYMSQQMPNPADASGEKFNQLLDDFNVYAQSLGYREERIILIRVMVDSIIKAALLEPKTTQAVQPEREL